MLVAAHPDEVVDVAGLGQADHRVEQKVGLGDLRRALGQLLMRPMHRVAGLERDHPRPAPLLELAAQVLRLVAQLAEVVLGRPREALEPAAEIDRLRPVEQVVDARMAVVGGAEHRLPPRAPGRARRCPATVISAIRKPSGSRSPTVAPGCSVLGELPADVERDRDRPQRAVGEPHARAHRLVVRLPEKALERREAAARAAASDRTAGAARGPATGALAASPLPRRRLLARQIEHLQRAAMRLDQSRPVCDHLPIPCARLSMPPSLAQENGFANRLRGKNDQRRRAVAMWAGSGKPIAPSSSHQPASAGRAPSSSASKLCRSITSRIGDAMISVCTSASIEGKRTGTSQVRDLCALDPGGAEQARQARRVAERERRSQQPDHLRPATALGDRRQRRVAARARERAADRDREPAARRQHAPHLAQRASRVGNEHQRELARHDIERRRPRTAGRRRRPRAIRSRARPASPPRASAGSDRARPPALPPRRAWPPRAPRRRCRSRRRARDRHGRSPAASASTTAARAKSAGTKLCS